MARQKVKLQLSFDGSDYQGFQKQKGTVTTVQGVLESALSKILDEPIQVVGCGRTDAGVHATKYFAHFWTNKNPQNYDFVYALNGPATPSSISIQQAWIAPDDFHALSSEHKTYKYLIQNSQVPNPFRQKYATFDRRPVDLEKLNELSKILLGKQDFKSFQTSGTESKTTIKTLHQAQWEAARDECIVFTVTGDGFLRQMVRNMVGTLLWLARHGQGPETLREILNSKDRQQAKDTAPPQGLYLTDIQYPAVLDKGCRKI